MHWETHQKHAQPKEPKNCGIKETKQRQYIDANNLANVRRDVLHKERTWKKQEINEIKEEVKVIVSKIKNNVEKRE